MATKILIRRGNTAEWTADNPVLDPGEPGYDETSNELKVGDGVTAWSSLPSVTSIILSSVVRSVNGVTPDASGSVVVTAITTVDDLQQASDLGKSFLKATTDSDARGLIGAGISNLVLGTDQGTALDAQTALDALATKATLGTDGLVVPSQLPSYVDAIVEVNTYADLPNPGTANKIYLTKDTNNQYRWGETTYVLLTASPGSSDAVPEGSVNLYFTNARAQAANASALAAKFTQRGAFTVGTAYAVNDVVSSGGVLFYCIQAHTAANPAPTVTTPTAYWAVLGAPPATKASLGLDQVDNTSDANKPLSSASVAALNGKVSVAGTGAVRIWPASTTFPTSGMQVGDLFAQIVGS